MYERNLSKNLGKSEGKIENAISFSKRSCLGNSNKNARIQDNCQLAQKRGFEY
jgi:hypothetical protein